MNEFRIMKFLSHRKYGGFSLVEMAMVLMIVGLLLGGLLPTISSQIEQQRRNETREQMDEIKDALTGFAIINGRLPCPAQATLVTVANNAGTEATVGTACSCKGASGNDNMIAWASGVACTDTSVTGVLPWATLGIDETDAWTRRYTYRVTNRFADQIAANTTDCTPAVSAPAASSFAICSPGVPDVLVTSGGTNVTTDAPAVIVSHGKNGCGAYIPTADLPTGNLIPIAVGDSSGDSCDNAGADQVENADNDNIFVSKDSSPSYDDIVIWLSHNTLINRMVTAGKLP